MSDDQANLSANGQLALHYAARGFYVFPCRSSSNKTLDKKPLVAHWRDESTRDPETIMRWWRQHPDALVALDCGKCAIVVVDADRHADSPDGVAMLKGYVGDNLRALGCPIVETPGNGLHLYFSQPGAEPPFGNSNGELAGQGIDVRGDGGYIIAPGSVRYDGAVYRPVEGAPDLAECWNQRAIPQVPDVISRLIRPPKTGSKDVVGGETDARWTAGRANVGARERTWAQAALAGKKVELAETKKGGRNNATNAIAYTMGRIIGAGWISSEEVMASLIEACGENGLGREDPRGSAATLARALKDGMAKPRGPLSDRDFGDDGDPIIIDDEERSGASSANHDQVNEAPRPLFRPLPPAAKYPVEALGDVLAPATRAIMDRVQCPDALAAQSVLAVASLAVQAHADVEIPATGHAKPTSLNMITIAPSGERKSAADGEALWPVRKREKALRETFSEELKDFFKARKAWDAAQKKATGGQKDDYNAIKGKLDAIGDEPPTPLMPMLTCPEPTFEGLCKLLADGQPAMGIFSDEGGSFIAGHGMSPDNRLRTVAGLSSIWDGSPIKRVRVIDGSSFIDGKRVALHLMAQPEAAARLLADPVLQDQGFLSRLLVAAPDSTAGTRFQRTPDPASGAALARYGARILAILERPPRLAEETRNELEPRVLPFDSDAARAWRDFADHVERLLAPGRPFEPIRGFANKLPEHAARIAAVLTLVDDLYTYAISRETFERAVVLAEYYAHEALRLFGTGCASPELQRAEALRNWLLTRWDEPLIGLAAIYQKGPITLRDAKTAKAAVNVLIEHGWLIPVNGSETVEGKTVREAWRIVKEGGQ